MTEGPGARLIADRVRSALAGRKLDRVEWPNSLIAGDVLAGRRVRGVRTHGKNILVDLSGEESFRIHLLMRGAIRIHRSDEPLDVPLRLGLWTGTTRVAVVGAPKIELLSTHELDAKLAKLGPDALDPTFDAGRFRRNLQAAGELSLAKCLLDQTIVAGVGNIWKAEILWEAGLDPRRRASSLKLTERSLLAKKVTSVLRDAYDTKRRGGKKKLAMYHRKGKSCPRCGASIEGYRLGGRMTYSCPICQR